MPKPTMPKTARSTRTTVLAAVLTVVLATVGLTASTTTAHHDADSTSPVFCDYHIILPQGWDDYSDLGIWDAVVAYHAHAGLESPTKQYYDRSEKVFENGDVLSKEYNGGGLFLFPHSFVSLANGWGNPGDALFIGFYGGHPYETEYEDTYQGKKHTAYVGKKYTANWTTNQMQIGGSLPPDCDGPIVISWTSTIETGRVNLDTPWIYQPELIPEPLTPLPVEPPSSPDDRPTGLTAAVDSIDGKIARIELAWWCHPDAAPHSILYRQKHQSWKTQYYFLTWSEPDDPAGLCRAKIALFDSDDPVTYIFRVKAKAGDSKASKPATVTVP